MTAGIYFHPAKVNVQTDVHHHAQSKALTCICSLHPQQPLRILSFAFLITSSLDPPYHSLTTSWIVPNDASSRCKGVDFSKGPLVGRDPRHSCLRRGRSCCACATPQIVGSTRGWTRRTATGAARGPFPHPRVMILYHNNIRKANA